MANTVFNQSPFLRTSRSFPIDAQALSVEIDRTYIDVANTVNDRTIGIFATNRPVINGEAWFLMGIQGKRQALRQVYQITGAGSIPHGINVSQIGGFTRIYGTFTNGSIWYPLPYVDAAAATNQVQITVTATNIVITAGGGAPAIVSGTVVLEWITSQ